MQAHDRDRLHRVNMMITRAMQYICTLQRKNTKNLIEPLISKLYFFRWQCMLQGFQQELLFVWEIMLNGGKKAVIITLTSEVPHIDHLVSAMSIRQMTIGQNNMSLFSKMLLLKMENDRTKNLGLVLYGGPQFWRVCGFINSDVNYCENGVVARPTPVSHPTLSAKINNFFNELYQKPEGQQQAALREVMTDVNEPPASRAVVTTKTGPQYETNIKLFSADLAKLKSLFLPIPEIGEHRWFMLHLVS